MCACARACRMGEESQQPTCPHVRHSRRCTHGVPSRRHSSQPLVLGAHLADRRHVWIDIHGCHDRASFPLSADSAWSSQLRSAATGAAPACRASICPWSRSSSVGTACTENRCEVAGALSTSTLTSLSCPARSRGELLQRRTHLPARPTPGCPQVDEHWNRAAFSAISAKSPSPAAAIHGSHWWQLPHRGFPAAAAGTRLRCPQCGHVDDVWFHARLLRQAARAGSE